MENTTEIESLTNSIVTMKICKDGICCVTDSRVIENNRVISDESYKSTVIKNINGMNILVGIAGTSRIGEEELTARLNRRFNNSSVNVEYYSPQFGVQSLLYTISQYVQFCKIDEETTALVFGYYQNNQPQLAIFIINKENINSLFTTSRYVVCGESTAVSVMSKSVINMNNISTISFAHACIDVMDRITYTDNNSSYGVGGFTNVVAIDNRGIKEIDLG